MGISSYSATPSSNTAINGINISEGCPPSGINDAIRQLMADLATDCVNKNTAQSLAAQLNFAQGANIASATTTDIGAATGNFVNVTGTTTITGFGTIAAGAWRIVKFTEALTLTYNATSLILPGAANITTAAGDIGAFISLGSGNWQCTKYTRIGGISTADIANSAVTNAKMANMAALTLSGNNTGSSAARQDLTVNQSAIMLVANNSFIPFRNRIINGKMDISQRGASFAAVPNNTYTLDRWIYYQAGAGVNTVSQQADVPSNNEFQTSLRVAVTTADAVQDASDIYAIQQTIEGYGIRDLIGRTFTLSFWVRSSKTGIHCAAFRNSGPDRSYVAEYTVNSANTWEYKTITVSGGLITAGTWNWNNGYGLGVSFSLMGGSTFRTTAGTLQTGNFLTTINQVNVMDTIGNIFAITGVQLEVGAVATPFEHRPFGAELALCQRYYSTATLRSNTSYTTGSGPGYLGPHNAFKVSMRSTPSIGFSGISYNNCSALITSTITTEGFAPSVSVSAGGNWSYDYTFTATAEL